MYWLLSSTWIILLDDLIILVFNFCGASFNLHVATRT